MAKKQKTHDRPAKTQDGAREKVKSSLTPPRSHDANWHDRIEKAKNAREQGRKAREGKPSVFPLYGYPTHENLQ